MRNERKICDHPDCREIGTYPAPKSRQNLQDYFFFCLTHVRQYNKNWNYYEGMNTQEIEAERDADVIGHRPLWNHSLSDSLYAELKDFLHNTDKGEGNNPYRFYDAPTRAALKILQVPPPINLSQIKAVYKDWVKKLHPDKCHATPPKELSDKKRQQAQDKLKQINQAYATLKLAFAENKE